MNILITTYFRANQLHVLLKSIQEQVTSEDLIYIVYQKRDTASRKILTEFKKINLISVEIDETGAINALLAGITRISPEGFLLLDDDVILHSKYLFRLKNIIDRNPKSIIAGTNLVIDYNPNSQIEVDKKIEESISREHHLIGRKFFFGFLVGRFQQPFEGELVKIDHFQGCNVYLPNSSILPSELFKADAVYYELSWAYKLKSIHSMYVKPDLTVLHVQPIDQNRVSSRDTNSLRRIYTTSRNMSLVINDIGNIFERSMTQAWFLVVGQKPIYGFLRALTSVYQERISISNAFVRFSISRRGWRKGRMMRNSSGIEVQTYDENSRTYHV